MVINKFLLPLIGKYVVNSQKTVLVRLTQIDKSQIELLVLSNSEAEDLPFLKTVINSQLFYFFLENDFEAYIK